MNAMQIFKHSWTSAHNSLSSKWTLCTELWFTFHVVLKYSCQIDCLHLQKRKIQDIIQASKQDMKFKNEMLKCQIKDIVSYPNMPFYDRQSVGTQQKKKKLITS